MTTTLKDIDNAIEQYKDLTQFLAGVRSTLFEMSCLAKKYYRMHAEAEKRIEKLEWAFQQRGELIEQLEGENDDLHSKLKALAPEDH